ncbi:MAG: chemotaxis protein CheA [Desulfobacterales bacterium]
MEDHKTVYKEETCELLAELETSLLELEDTPERMELIDQVFRSMHTIKGSGAMFGFENIATFTHEIETVYDLVRDGKIPVSKKLIDLTLAACDLIKAMVGGESANESEEIKIVRFFQELIPVSETVSKADAPDIFIGTGEDEFLYRIRFRPDADIFHTGTNPLLLLEDIRTLGTCEIVLHQSRVPPLRELDPESCYLYWDILLNTAAGINAIRDMFIFVEDKCHLDIEPIEISDSSNPGFRDKKIGEILVERGDISPKDVAEVLSGQRRMGEMLVEKNLIDPETLASALTEQRHIREADQRRQNMVSASSIRVSAEKLDTLMNLMGELVTVQARLSRKASLAEDSELNAVAEEVDRLCAELRDNTMDMRMLPVGSTFRKFRRLIHDLSTELGKEVNVTTGGEETELDKTVLEQISDPLIHIIRNSLDHGIELPAVRAAKGKPRQGTICLEAEHSGSDVHIRISDDGAGIDPDSVLAKAVEKGLVPPESAFSEKEIFSFLFMPGFSTARQVTGVSGRGVGMDVVKRRIESLRGSVDIRSEKDRGTTVTLRLPLTLAIAEGLLVQVGEGEYVLPLLSVEECMELSRGDAEKARRQNLIPFRGEIISYISLREYFGAGGKSPDMERVVVMENRGCRVGIGVDRIVGQHQTVIKSLGKFYRNIKSMSGATILGDGSVALILDVEQIVQSMQKKAER